MLAFMVSPQPTCWCTPPDNGRSWRYRIGKLIAFVLNFAHLIVNVLLRRVMMPLLESV